MDEIRIELGVRRTKVTVYEDVPYTIPKEKNCRMPKILTEAEKQKKEQLKEVFSQSNYWRRLKKRRDTFKEIAFNNFEVPHVSLVTLTFDDSNRNDKDYTVLDQTHREFKNFILRMNRVYDNFRYIAVFSRQQNGNWHYHMLCNLDRQTSSEEIGAIWKLGYVWIDYIESNSDFYDKVSYCVRNMQECGVAELQGEKGYLCSKNLNRNIVLRTWKEDEEQRCEEVFEELKDKPKKLLYTAKKVQGVKAKTVDEETGEILTYYDDQIQLNDWMKDCGYEEWISKFHHITSSVRYPELFNMLPTATKKLRSLKGCH